MNMADPWIVLTNSLTKRRPPTADQERDAHNAKIRADRLRAIKEGRYRQSIEQKAETEKKILNVCKKLKLACIDDLRELVGMTAHHIRNVAMSMVKDGRLEIKVGTYGKKFWRVK